MVSEEISPELPVCTVKVELEMVAACAITGATSHATIAQESPTAPG